MFSPSSTLYFLNACYFASSALIVKHKDIATTVFLIIYQWQHINAFKLGKSRIFQNGLSGFSL